MSTFPIDLSKYKKLEINPFTQETLTDAQRSTLISNIEICRNAIVFFTACGSASGYGGHTGGAFDTVPEVMIMEAFFNACPDKFVPLHFDEAGHRVATQYLLAALHGDLDPMRLMDYRKGHSHLPGHPELGFTPGVKFSSGRLGHMWPYVNGVAMANEGKTVFCLGSDGSQQEGDDAEAARLAVAQGLNVKVLVDDNDVTIAGHPSDYLKGYSVTRTLQGHGLVVDEVKGERIDELYAAIRRSVLTPGPVAVVSKRKMAVGIAGIEGETHGHDAVAPKYAIPYLEARGLTQAVEMIKARKKTKDPQSTYLGSGKIMSNRGTFGTAVADILSKMDPAEKRERVKVVDCDLEGSTGLAAIHKAHPDIYVLGGIMERGNISAAAGFGMAKGKQGIFSTFGAFLEMCISEITMARLNNSNLLCHFSHSGVDDMADNTCHFGINNFFADNGLADQYATGLYFPADALQLTALLQSIFFNEGLRFVFSTRSKLPVICGTDGKPMYGPGYKYRPGKDDIVRTGTAGYIVSFGDAVYRALDAVERLKKEGIDVGLINKSTLNVVDEETLALVGKAPFVLVVEPFNVNTGLGIRFGTWLLERGSTPKYAHIGVHQEGAGGLWEQAYHQGYDSSSVVKKVKSMVSTKAKL